MRRIPSLAMAALVVAAACGDQPTDPIAAHSAMGMAPVLSAAPRTAIPGAYVVVLNDAASPDRVAAAAGVRPRQTWSAALRGFAATLNQGQLNALQHDPAVKWIEQEQRYTLSGTQYSAPWGLDRVDQADRPVDGTFTYDMDGYGVHAYVIDSGIRTDHVDFGGRASVGADYVGDGQNGIDCFGHGTHVAGLIGGDTYGAAKQVSLVSVRIFSCYGSTSTSAIISGFNWVAANRVLPAVANASFGGPASSSIDAAVNGTINAGVTVVIAAGNDNLDACTVSPARVSAAITVGATSQDDSRAVWDPTESSNYGSCLDIFAPGTDIPSDWYTSTTATMTKSGTSMASPLVAGVAAQYLETHPTATPANVASALTSVASSGKVSNAGTGSPNRLLFSRLPLPAPAVTVTYPGGTPTLTWSALIGVGSYTVTYVKQYVYDDGYEGIYQENWTPTWLGDTYDTSFVDQTHTYTGSEGCTLHMDAYVTEYENYYYQVDAHYGETTTTTMVPAQVGNC